MSSITASKKRTLLDIAVLYRSICPIQIYLTGPSVYYLIVTGRNTFSRILSMSDFLGYPHKTNKSINKGAFHFKSNTASHFFVLQEVCNGFQWNTNST